MSKLYVSATTDTVKTSRTARGNKRVDASIGYDEGDYSKKIKTELTRDGDKIELAVTDKYQTLLVCDGTIQKGIIECQPYSYAGPMPKLSLTSILD